MTPDSERNRGPQPPADDFSFDALANEMEGYLPRKQEIEVPTRDFEGNEISLDEQDRLRQKKEMEQKINAKVLGASGSKSGPMWFKGLIVSGVSLGVYVLLLSNQGVAPAAMYSYITMAIGAGAALWCINGVTRDEAAYEKVLNGVGFAVAAAVVVAAFLKLP
ncbi:MAG: hypothetical protein GC168_15660 [Candidatus Hydrogenedens sp.]|nr:hypothetical protein [Candidatus Hydrogenedens sp.]